MCCNGTLFNYVTLTDDEVPALEKYPQVQIKVRNHQPTFDEACVLHTGTGCSVYEIRPDTCRRYICEVVRDVRDGRLGETEAVAVIATGRALVDEMKSLIAFEPGMPLVISSWNGPPEGLSDAARASWLGARNHLHTHFLPPMDEPPAKKVEPVSDTTRFPRDRLFEQ